MIYFLFSIMAGGLFYVYYDIRFKKRLHKYIMVNEEKIRKLNNLDVIISAFSKIPLVAAITSLTGIVLNYFVGMISIFMTFTMLLVLTFIWFNSVRTVINAVEK